MRRNAPGTGLYSRGARRPSWRRRRRVSGAADAAVAALLAGKLSYDPDMVCAHHHHEEGHDCGGHCGENKHGCAGNH